MYTGPGSRTCVANCRGFSRFQWSGDGIVAVRVKADEKQLIDWR